MRKDVLYLTHLQLDEMIDLYTHPDKISDDLKTPLIRQIDNLTSLLFECDTLALHPMQEAMLEAKFMYLSSIILSS